MGVTGLIGIGFVILHVAGNLQVFEGQAKLNGYSAMLHGPLDELLWVLRVVLVVAVVLHVTMAYQLTRRSAGARPIGYKRREPQVSTLAARTMKWGGVLLLVFIVVSHPALHDRDVRPGARGGDGRPSWRPRRLRQHRRELPRLVGRGVLHRRDGRARTAPLSRRMELAAHARLRQAVGRIRCTAESRSSSPWSSGSGSAFVPVGVIAGVIR